MPIERYSVTFDPLVPVNSGHVYAEMLAGAADPISIKSITVTTKTNLGGQVALSRSRAIGTGAATGVFTGVAHRMGATSATGPAKAYIAWSSSGVSPTGFTSRLRSEVLPVGTGSSTSLWDSVYDGPLVLEPGTSILLMNHASGIDAGGLRVNVTWDEGRL